MKASLHTFHARHKPKQSYSIRDLKESLCYSIKLGIHSRRDIYLYLKRGQRVIVVWDESKDPPRPFCETALESGYLSNVDFHLTL